MTVLRVRGAPAEPLITGSRGEEHARICGADAERIGELYRLFCATERVVTAFSQGVNQSSAGTDKVNSIINCHLLTGRIGRPGMGPLSLTGQPNAMGGREVGGLANTLAAHLDLESDAHRAAVQEFWRSPRIALRPGLKAVELFEAMHTGRIKAVWIMATNPVVSLPDADRAREALRRCGLVVVSDCAADTDTTALAHVLLPAASWGEKDGTVTNSERRISRQRQFLAPPGEARPDWWIVSEVARRMGFEQAFRYESPREIFDEHARLCALACRASLAFDITGLAGLSARECEELEPTQWPVQRRGADGVARLFQNGRFMHADGKARLVPVHPRGPHHATDASYPFALNTGRIRDQWHTMTRTGRAPRLTEHLPEPFVDLHAHDALLTSVQAGELATVRTRWGSMVARVRISGEVPRGALFVPMHWSDSHASQGRVGALVNPAVDPLSGEPEFKHTPASIQSFPVEWYGVVLARRPIAARVITWWTLIYGAGFLRYELAGREVPADWAQWVRNLLGVEAPDADYLEYRDAAAVVYRAACLSANRLEACAYVFRRAELPARGWLAHEGEVGGIGAYCAACRPPAAPGRRYGRFGVLLLRRRAPHPTPGHRQRTLDR
jgi:assimilatory nitrate reductase catalytic subunit